jgi:4-amino-4-deoxy-L-arabinose transferase-like glycosyltransferase
VNRTIVNFFRRRRDIFLSRNFLLAFLVLIGGYIVFNNLGTNPLSTDSYIYANISQSMIRNHDFVTMTFVDKPFFGDSKGILLYWLSAISGEILGFNSFSMRLPAAILCFSCILFMFFILEKQYNYIFAFVSSGVLLLTQQFLYHARSLLPDGIFAVFFAFSAASFYFAVSKNKSAYYYLFGLFLALSVLIRQSLGLMVLPVVFCYALSLKERKKVFTDKHLYFSCLLATFLVLPWYVAAYKMYGEVFLKEYLATPYKILTGASGTDSPFVGSQWHTYVNILAANYEPWLIFAMIGIFFSAKKILKEKSLFGVSFEKFTLIWALQPLLLVHFLKGHQYYFIVPIYIPLAILSTFGIYKFFKNKNAVVITFIFIILLFAILCAFKLLPKTLDARHHIYSVELIPAMTAIKEPIYTTGRPKFYSSIFEFFTGRRVIGAYNPYDNSVEIEDANEKGLSDEDFDRMMRSGKKYFFLSYRDYFEEKVSGKYKVNIIAETNEDILFSNQF